MEIGEGTMFSRGRSGCAEGAEVLSIMITSPAALLRALAEEISICRWMRGLGRGLNQVQGTTTETCPKLTS